MPTTAIFVAAPSAMLEKDVDGECCSKGCPQPSVSTKFALSGMTECWRTELSPHNVHVMQINPSEVITEFDVCAGSHAAATNVDRKHKASEIAHVVHAMLSMHDVGFITEVSVWATNP